MVPADLADPALFAANGQAAVFAGLRAAGPLHHHPGNDRVAPFWSVVSYHDVLAISRRPDAFSSARGVTIAPRWAQGVDFDAMQPLLTTDPPRHAALRSVVSGALMARPGAWWEQAIRALVVERLDRFLRGGGGDFVSAVAAPVAAAVVCELLGAPPDAAAFLASLVDPFLAPGDPACQIDLPAGMPPGSAEAAVFTGGRAAVQVLEFVAGLLERPWSAGADDVLSLLRRASHPAEMLGEDEVLLLGGLLVPAALATTRDALSGGLHALAEHPEQLATLYARPGLVAPAIEEVLRWVSPILHMARVATRDTVVAGQPIREGERLVLWYPSANRDERVFPAPHRFDAARRLNPHLAFGAGEHRCPGAGLARLQLRVLLEELVQRAPRLEVRQVRRLHSTVNAGMASLVLSTSGG